MVLVCSLCSAAYFFSVFSSSSYTTHSFPGPDLQAPHRGIVAGTVGGHELYDPEGRSGSLGQWNSTTSQRQWPEAAFSRRRQLEGLWLGASREGRRRGGWGGGGERGRGGEFQGGRSNGLRTTVYHGESNDEMVAEAMSENFESYETTYMDKKEEEGKSDDGVLTSEVEEKLFAFNNQPMSSMTQNTRDKGLEMHTVADSSSQAKPVPLPPEKAYFRTCVELRA